MKISRKTFRICIWIWFAAIVLLGILGKVQLGASIDSGEVPHLGIWGGIILLLCFWVNIVLLLAMAVSIIGMTMFKKWGRFIFAVSQIGVIIPPLIMQLIFDNEIKSTLFMQIIWDISYVVSMGTGAIICAAYLVPSIAEEFKK